MSDHALDIFTQFKGRPKPKIRTPSTDDVLGIWSRRVSPRGGAKLADPSPEHEVAKTGVAASRSDAGWALHLALSLWTERSESIRYFELRHVQAGTTTLLDPTLDSEFALEALQEAYVVRLRPGSQRARTLRLRFSPEHPGDVAVALLADRWSSSEWREGVIHGDIVSEKLITGPAALPTVLDVDTHHARRSSLLRVALTPPARTADLAEAEASVEPETSGALRYGGALGLSAIFGSIPLLLLEPAAGFTGMFLGAALVSLANYAAYRVGDSGWFLRPATASRLFLGSLALAITSIIAGITHWLQ
jgi:hypothetical protein